MHRRLQDCSSCASYSVSAKVHMPVPATERLLNTSRVSFCDLFTTGILSSNYIGSAIAPIIIVPLILWFGWRGMFQALGCIGLFYVFFYAFCVKQTKPAEEVKAGKKENKTKTFLHLMKFSIIWKCSLRILRILHQ